MLSKARSTKDVMLTLMQLAVQLDLLLLHDVGVNEEEEETLIAASGDRAGRAGRGCR